MFLKIPNIYFDVERYSQPQMYQLYRYQSYILYIIFKVITVLGSCQNAGLSMRPLGEAVLVHLPVLTAISVVIVQILVL